MKSIWSQRGPRRSSAGPLWIVVLLGVVATGVFALRWRHAEDQLERTRAWAVALVDSVGLENRPPGPAIGPEGRDSVYWQWVATSAQMQTRRTEQSLRELKQQRGSLLAPNQVQQLKAEGLEDPARQLRDSLLAHPELAPAGKNDPKMSFLRERVVLLERPYVFAYAENGREGGYLLLEYRIQPGPRVRWRRLWWAPLASDEPAALGRTESPAMRRQASKSSPLASRERSRRGRL